jgi:hypothetical protein
LRPGRGGLASTCRIATKRLCHPVPASRRRGVASGTGRLGQHLPDRQATMVLSHIAPCPRRDAGAVRGRRGPSPAGSRPGGDSHTGGDQRHHPVPTSRRRGVPLRRRRWPSPAGSRLGDYFTG